MNGESNVADVMDGIGKLRMGLNPVGGNIDV
jgi:hypothetical protein